MLKHIKSNTKEYYVDENGMKQGECKAYYQNGQLRAIYNYVNNKLHGEYKSYHSNDKLCLICNYDNNKLHGVQKSYYQNGQLRQICNYVNSRYHGEYKTYHENGKLIKHKFYNMDKHVDLSIHGMDINNISKDDINLLMVIYA